VVYRTESLSDAHGIQQLSGRLTQGRVDYYHEQQIDAKNRPVCYANAYTQVSVRKEGMGSKQKSVKNGDKSTGSGVVVVKTSRLADSRLVKKWRTLNPRLRVGVVGVVLLLVIGAVLVITHHPAPPPKTPLPSYVDTDYQNTELANLPLLLEYDYGLSKDDVMHGNLHHELKTFDEAHNVAYAIARFGDRHRSLDAYKIAVDKAPKDTPDTFYMEVMSVSYQMGDRDYGYQMFQKAVAAVNSSKMTAAEKRTAVARDTALYQLTKQGKY
jgi:hypothetical protein